MADHPLANADGNAGGKRTDRATGAVPLWHARDGARDRVRVAGGRFRTPCRLSLRADMFDGTKRWQRHAGCLGFWQAAA